MQNELSKAMSRIYYSTKGYWKGFSAVSKLASAAKVSEEEARKWLEKQALWQIYLPAPKYIPRPHIDLAFMVFELSSKASQIKKGRGGGTSA